MPTPTLGKPSTKKAAKSAPKPYRHGSLRESLLAAQGITLRDVANAPGVSRAAPYHHFVYLNTLPAAVAEESFVSLGEALVQTSTKPDIRERLLRINEAYGAHACARPVQFRRMFGPLLVQRNDSPRMKAARPAWPMA
jgi:AcrR family transcriptional regulator